MPTARASRRTLPPTFLTGTNFVLHRSGGSTRAWSCHEKFIVDIKLLLEQRHEWTTPRLHELHEEEFVVCPRVKLDD